MRKILVGIIVLGFLGSVLVVAAPAGTRREGSFTARGVPAPFLLIDGCTQGIEGVHKTSHAFTAPSDGLLRVTMSDFRGDWDVVILGEKGKILRGGWNGRGRDEDIHEFLDAGQKVSITACNWLSTQHEVEVRFTFGPRAVEDSSVGPFVNIKKDLPVLKERVPINFVFLGYGRDQIDLPAFSDVLPETYRPRERMPRFYGHNRPLGIHYTYDYRSTFATQSYEDRFFARLKALGTDSPPTIYQGQYNAQEKNVVDIDRNLKIDAARVEEWLAENPPSGVDTQEPTVFFINWYGRKDFRFHVYMKSGEPDTDTGYDAGLLDYQAMIAWGGTPPDDPETGFGSLRRVWFYDLSAGPEYWTDNYLVDVKDLDGDGKENYRMPPIWEYAKNGYRKPAALSSDLGKVARYVAINLLFTPSPLYGPGLSPPALPRSVDLDLNVYEGQPNVDATEKLLDAGEVRKAVEDLTPAYTVTADEEELDLRNEKQVECYGPYRAAFSEGSVGIAPPCFADRPYSPWSNLFLFHALNLGTIYDDQQESDYEVGAFNYVLPDNVAPGCFAYADDNQVDGTQSFVFFFLNQACARFLGLTDILIHEMGHHFGLSHPHDGFDFEDHMDYSGYQDKWYFTWVGDEVNDMMSYMFHNNEYSQFARDNVNRWLTAEYAQQVNALAQRLLAADAQAAADNLHAADGLLGKAKDLFAAHQYEDALAISIQAFDLVTEAAREAGIKIVGSDDGTAVLPPSDEPLPYAGSPGAYAYVDFFSPGGQHSHHRHGHFVPSHR